MNRKIEFKPRKGTVCEEKRRRVLVSTIMGIIPYLPTEELKVISDYIIDNFQGGDKDDEASR